MRFIKSILRRAQVMRAALALVVTIVVAVVESRIAR